MILCFLLNHCFSVFVCLFVFKQTKIYKIIYFKQIGFSVGARKKVHFGSIHDAVRAGDVKQLSEMVERGARINEVDILHKFTPLHWAAHSGSLEVRSYINDQTGVSLQLLAVL